jgi:outer membrane autotransporter protein
LTKVWGLESSRPITTWARANLWHSFGADSKTTFGTLDGLNPAALKIDLGGSWAQLGIGASAQLASTITAFAAGDYNFAIDKSNGKSLSGRVGLKVIW